MKKIFIKFSILLFFTSFLSSQENRDIWQKELETSFLSDDEIYILYWKNSNKYSYGDNEDYIKSNLPYTDLLIKLSLRDDIKLNKETGYLSFKNNDKNILFIPSRGLYKTIIREENPRKFLLQDSQEELHLKKSDYPGDRRQYDFTLRNITVSSYLTEKTKNGIWKYDGQDIERFPILSGEDTTGKLLPNIPMPWVEGKDDDGIGEWIEFETHGSMQTLFFVNGFVDVRRPHLFKENNRIKNATLICTPENKDMPPFEMKIEFKDFVYTKTIEIPERCSKFKLVIDSVYKGTKYSDTVLTSIYTLGTQNDI